MISLSSFQTNLKELCLGTKLHSVSTEDESPVELGLWEKVSHLGNEQYHHKRVQLLAQHYTKELKGYFEKHPKRDVTDALNDPFIYTTVRNFLRNEGSVFKNDPLVQECKRLHFAAKLGISPEVFEANEGFETFAASAHLERYLFMHKDEIKVDGENKISLKYKGEYTSWSQIKSEEIPRDPKPEGEMRYARPYDKTGVVWNKDYFVFDELEPMFELENGNEWGNIDILEICACKSVDNWMSILTGVHAWLRVKTADGKIYSFGIYRPEKLSGWEHIILPFRTKIGFLSYEISEYWPLKDEDLRTVQIQITPKQREDILKRIKDDKANNLLVFQAFHDNCLVYAKKLLKEYANIYIPTHESVYGILNPERVKVFTNYIPQTVRKVCVTVGSIFINFLQVILGGTLVDKRVKEIHGDSVKPHFNSIKDFFNPEKAMAHHPYTVLYKTHDWVEAWRAEERERLEKEDTDEAREKLRLLFAQIPPKDYLYY